MTRKPAAPLPARDEDTPAWTDAQRERAEQAAGDMEVRPAADMLARAGPPSLVGAAKRQVTLRLDPDVIERFRADGPGWQGRMNAALRKAAGL